MCKNRKCFHNKTKTMFTGFLLWLNVTPKCVRNLISNATMLRRLTRVGPKDAALINGVMWSPREWVFIKVNSVPHLLLSHTLSHPLSHPCEAFSLVKRHQQVLSSCRPLILDFRTSKIISQINFCSLYTIQSMLFCYGGIKQTTTCPWKGLW